MPKPIKVIGVNAPKKSEAVNIRSYVELSLVPNYRAACETYDKYDIHLDIFTDSGTVSSIYYARVNEILREICPELISRYAIITKRAKR